MIDWQGVLEVKIMYPKIWYYMVGHLNGEIMKQVEHFKYFGADIWYIEVEE